MVLIKSLNLDSFKTVLTVLTVKKFLTVSIPKSQQSQYPKVSIFDIALTESHDLNSFKHLVLKLKKFLGMSL